MAYFPKSEAELAEVVAGLDAPVQVKGGGTRPIGRSAGDVLSLSGLSGVSLYEPGALTLVAGAGTPVREVEDMLAAEGQRLAFEPMDHRILLGTKGEPTLGGLVAANVSGPRRIAVGACRDFTLGVRFVDGTGRVLKNGGRVMKNVTGYDLVKLMSGSFGTLGAISEVSLKVLPVPETETTLVLHGQDEARAVEAMSAALGSPYEVTGAAHADGATYLRLEGFATSVDYRAGELAKKLGEAERLDAAASAAIWSDIKNVKAFADHAFVAKLSIRPSALDAFCFAAANTFTSGKMTRHFDLMVDWGGGLVWIAATEEQLAAAASVAPDDKPAKLRGAELLIDYLQSYCTKDGGHATLVKAPDALWPLVSAFQPEAAGVARLSEAVRQKFDPKGLFNAGLMARS